MTKLTKITLFSTLFGSFLYLLAYYFIDKPIAYSLHNISHQSTIYKTFQYITLFGDVKLAILFIIFSFIAAALILYKKPHSALANTLFFICLSMGVVIFLESSLKFLLGRYRPELLFEHNLYGFHFFSHQFLMNSSPSGHAARTFVFITALSLIWKRATLLFIAAGLLVCCSRLILEFHFLSDVLFGAALGVLATLWVAKYYNSLASITQKGKTPEV
jgi:membrane-associated phospholipid phosphatase